MKDKVLALVNELIDIIADESPSRGDSIRQGTIKDVDAIFKDHISKEQLTAGAAMHRICGLGSDPAVTDTVETLIAYAAQWHNDRANLQICLDDYGKHVARAQKMLAGSGLGKNILEAALDEIDALRKRAEAAEELLKPVTYGYTGISVIGDQYDWYKRRNAHLKEYAP